MPETTVVQKFLTSNGSDRALQDLHKVFGDPEAVPSGALVAAGATYQLGTGLGQGRTATLLWRLHSG
jgi:hypothetical protein